MTFVESGDIFMGLWTVYVPISKGFYTTLILFILCLLAVQSIYWIIWSYINLGALKSSLLKKLHIFQCKGTIFSVGFQMYPLKFHATHILKGTIFKQCWKFKSSQIYELVRIVEACLSVYHISHLIHFWEENGREINTFSFTMFVKQIHAISYFTSGCIWQYPCAWRQLW